MPSIAHELAELGHEVYLTGGTYQRKIHLHTRLFIDKRVRQMNADRLLLGTDGVDEEGLTARAIHQARIKRTLIRNAKRVVPVADHSKFDDSYAFQFASHSSVDMLITGAVPSAIRPEFSSADVDVVETT